MLNLSRPWSVRNLFFCLSLIACVSASTVRAQTPETPLQRQLDRMELDGTAIGIITKGVSGTNTLNPPNQMMVTQEGSTTALGGAFSWSTISSTVTMARFAASTASFCTPTTPHISTLPLRSAFWA